MFRYFNMMPAALALVVYMCHSCTSRVVDFVFLNFDGFSCDLLI